ncbi:MAG: hypothetical protein HON65_09085 [Rhodospirillales bacterium]|jgi:cytochrome c553|nr:hypothetical protein [Rhodospirillales bacterium]
MLNIKGMITPIALGLIFGLFLSVVPVSSVSAADQGTVAWGGKLYDKWFKIAGSARPKGTHVAWPASNTKKKGSATHRCKACHGWDTMGKDGAYASGSYQTGIVGVRKYDGENPADVVAILKDNTHGFADLMAEKDLTALGVFVTSGQVDMDKSIDRASKKFIGDVAQGKQYYVTMCTNCHGVDGKLPKDMPEPLGKLSNKNPWEIMHKIQNGTPGEEMPALRALPIQVTADVGAYLQTLPE